MPVKRPRASHVRVLGYPRLLARKRRVDHRVLRRARSELTNRSRTRSRLSLFEKHGQICDRLSGLEELHPEVHFSVRQDQLRLVV